MLSTNSYGKRLVRPCNRPYFEMPSVRCRIHAATLIPLLGTPFTTSSLVPE
jgi:hypothetical protein